MKDGWSHRRACGVLELKDIRAWRWRLRRSDDRLADKAPGGHPVHRLLPEEEAEIVALFEEWGEVDRPHRKLAHRGSYLKVWVSPSSVKRVLAAQGLHLRHPKRAGSSARRPFPAWATYTKGMIWIYDATHFQACPTHAAVAVMDLVTRKWLSTVLSVEETSTQVQVAFLEALEAEGMLEEDQAWIESLFGHLKAEWPHLDRIADPALLRAELDGVRTDYNTRRLHAGIGYVTPDDEHEGRGPAIRKDRKEGLFAARKRRIAYHRQKRQNDQPQESQDVD